MFRYDPPASVDDLKGGDTRERFLEDWHAFIEGEFRSNIDQLKNPVIDGQLFDTPVAEPLFFTEADALATSQEIPISWNAFPLSISRRFPNRPQDAWAEADNLRSTDLYTPDGAEAVITQFRPQDEYCEWHYYGDRIVFTAEGPEYWIQLARHDFDAVLEAYRNRVSGAVKDHELRLKEPIQYGSEILHAGSYDPFNRWNTIDGALHLTHPANTLGAEINLAARATIPRRSVAGQRIAGVRELACSSNFGDPNRSSDPNIGNAANITAMPPGGGAPISVTLANPVGLYINALRPGTLTDADGNPLDHWFQIKRGVAGRGLFAVLGPPPGAPFGLDKVQVAGVALTHGGQVAAHIDMVLYARTADFGKPPTPLAHAVGCCCVPAGTPATALPRLNFRRVSKPKTCAELGNAQQPPISLDEAFADCKGTPGPAPHLMGAAPSAPGERSVQPARRPRGYGTRNAD